MKLLFVRHGETESNVRGVLESEVPGPPLTPKGRLQADAMSEEVGRRRIDAIYTSTQLRAIQTAGRLASLTGVPLYVRHGLREIESGDYTFRGDDEAIAGYWDAITAWARGDFDAKIPGAESGAEVFERLDAVIDEIASSGHETVAVVSHGGSIRGWTAARGRRSAETVARHALDNTGVVEVVGDPSGGWTITSWMGRPLVA